jgi:O-antigen/teichoic acid export membrane protein
LIASTPIAAILFIFAGPLVSFLNVPQYLHADASLALRFAAITFVIHLLNGIINTPQLTRLRMDLNTLVTVVFRIAGLVATPLVLYLGGTIATALFVVMVATVLTLIGHLLVSRSLLPNLFELSIEKPAIGPMLRYGGALAGAGIASVLLINLEKLVLTRTTSVETLAYYSVAFTLAMMMTMLSASMTQSLVPAFAQLLGPGKRDQLNSLFLRASRINTLIMLPVLAVLFTVARPFFTLWAGEDFGRESTVPFYILLVGLAFAINNYVPMSLLMASGRTDVVAKLYWGELVPYLGLIVILTDRFGAVGAASAWTIRVIADTALVWWIARQTTGVSLHEVERRRSSLILLLVLLPLIALTLWIGFSYILVLALPVFVGAYAVLAWSKFLASEEKIWLMNKFSLPEGRRAGIRFR